MTRREFGSSLLIAASAGTERADRPRMLIARDDPFSGVRILQARYRGGIRPPDDIAGWALSWLLASDEQAAERAVAEMRRTQLPGTRRPARSWVDYTRWALAFDWLYTFRGFDGALKDRIAGELQAGAEAMRADRDMSDAGQVAYHNYALRYLCLASFAIVAIQGHGDGRLRLGDLQTWAQRAFDNILDLTQLVTPEGSYHESMDYMRITWAPLALLAELRRTTTGIDPAQTYTVFRNFAETYLYKLMPNGTPSREGDNEYPILDTRDTTCVGYAVHRLKDPYAAWMLRRSGWFGKEWVLPVLQFLWDDPEVMPLDPATVSERELPRQRYFPAMGHLVMRNGWKPDATWIEFDCGSYFAKHQHLDQNQFTIFHNGYLAIDSGADYTETESPHYLNYYRRTVAHNSVLVFDPAEKFFWSENIVPAANDGGQRMDSSRLWNTVRSQDDWERTKDLWDLGHMRRIEH
ncbi:MAG: heparinase II/III family protein, partial [Acidobacteriaceae bacterium]|nr:heparinase II/III family protein [Acidobacteriaceae bacterium]